MKIDLHMHSTHSDGEMKPEELLYEALKNGVSVMSITDHDEISGYIEAIGIARRLGMALIPAIEFNTDGPQGELHILGYGMNPYYKKLIEYTTWRKDERLLWAEKIVAKLNELGYNIEWEDCLKRVTGNVIVRTHIAVAFIDF
ncbi:PHP domain-containing protein [Salipaludibacillus sp. CF4.18]|uniref:PHP domain-containing protein n=1 Tax=Salipaludibacillus sp. CF4.18 TaxID=3373081 RepID=UPI003EE69ADF